MKNANFDKDKVTTRLGIILFFFTLVVYIGMLAAPYVVAVPKEMTVTHWYVPHTFLCVGIVASIVLIIAPDTFVRGVNKGIDKKFS